MEQGGEPHPLKIKEGSKSKKSWSPSETDNEIGKQKGECSQTEDKGRGLETHKEQ